MTSAYGATSNRPKNSTNPHRGVDLNYFGGQSGVNLVHPDLHAPVDGIVTNAGQGTAGRIAIRDADGLSHELLHTHTRNVSIGDRVVAGQLVGTMGNTGVKSPDVEDGDHHLHYQIKDSRGHPVNPSAFWDHGSNRTDASNAAPVNSDVAGPFGTGGQFAPGLVTSPWSLYDTRSFVPPMDEAGKRDDSRNVRRLVRVSGPTARALIEMAAKPVGPFNDMPPDRPTSFGDRFGDWDSSPRASAPRGPDQPGLSQQGSRKLGLVSGKPMPDYPFASPIWGAPDNSGSHGDDIEDWYRRWLGAAR